MAPLNRIAGRWWRPESIHTFGEEDALRGVFLMEGSLVPGGVPGGRGGAPPSPPERSSVAGAAGDAAPIEVLEEGYGVLSAQPEGIPELGDGELVGEISEARHDALELLG